MAELTEKDIERLAMVLKSLCNDSKFNKYKDYIPATITSKMEAAVTVEEYALMEGLQSQDLKEIIKNLRQAYRSIKIEHSNRTYRHRYGRSNMAYKRKIKSLGLFSKAWKNLIKDDRHMEVLDFMATRPKKGKPPEFQIYGCVGEWMCKQIVIADKVDDTFLDFVIEGKGRKYFNVPVKKMLVNHLHQNKRLDDMYRFCGAGSKTVNDLVVRLAEVDDLPFLMTVDGYTAKQRLEKRIDKAK